MMKQPDDWAAFAEVAQFRRSLQRAGRYCRNLVKDGFEAYVWSVS